MGNACGNFAQVRHEALLSAIEFGFGRVTSHNQALDAFNKGQAEVTLEKRYLLINAEIIEACSSQRLNCMFRDKNRQVFSF